MNFKKILLLSCLPLSTIHSYGQKPKENKAPNIIVILMDDLGYGDLGAFFQNQRRKTGDKSEPWLLTPNLDKMASEGAMLPENYCAAPVCAPSRASLLSGVSQGHANVRDNQFDKALENNFTIGSMLQKAGYVTAAIGKWGLQGKGKGPEWPAHPLKRGFDYYYGYMRHGDGHEHYPKEGLYRGEKQVFENYKDVTLELDKCYTGDLFTAAAKNYIMEHQKGKDASKPFFMYLAYDTPHAVLELPTQAYPKGSGLNGGLQWLGKPGQMINTASGKIDSYVHPDYAHATYDEDKNPATPEVAWPDTYKRYATVNRRIDDQVGDIIALLKDLKIDENTMVVFTSDNGPSKESYLPKGYVNYDANFFNNFGPFDGIKRDCLEGGLRAATIAFWPGRIAPKTVIETPSISYDWLPTFADAAGLSAPVRTDGVSLLPSLTNKGKQEKSLIYVEYFHNAASPDYDDFAEKNRDKKRNQMQMMRFGDTVAVRYNIKSAADNFEIYDIVNDPQEAKNLASSHPELQQFIKNRTTQVRMVDTAAARPYDSESIAAVHPEKLGSGLSMKTFNVMNDQWIPKVNTMKPASVATVKSPEPSGKNNMYLFEGYIKVPADGEYTFYLSADYKAFLKLHDISVIDEDFGYPGNQEKESKIRLKAGYHPLKVYYMAKKAAEKTSLNLQWSVAGGSKTTIPADIFFN